MARPDVRNIPVTLKGLSPASQNQIAAISAAKRSQL
jgi:hypothetical protein